DLPRRRGCGRGQPDGAEARHAELVAPRRPDLAVPSGAAGHAGPDAGRAEEVTFTPRTWIVGEVVSAATMNQEIRDQFNSMFAAWTAYTPSWTASTSNPALGNGTITGRYMKYGRTVWASIKLTTGST